MTPIQQLMQTGQAKANEIFAKLLDTSAAAVRTRDRVFSDLKAELDRQAKFEEQRLFPVLKQHNGTKDLVAQVQNDNQQARKLLAELERTPKDNEAFVAKVTELRDLFQRRLRGDRNEILPAIVKADEEARTAAGKIEGETTAIVPARRAEGGEHQPGDEHDTVAAARETADLVEAGTDLAQQGAEVVRVAAETGVNTAFVNPSVVSLLNEHARHALQIQTVMAARHAQRLAEVAGAQSAFMAASFQRLGQLNDRYLAMARDWRGVFSAPSSHR